MTKHSAANERIKREYFSYLAQAKGRDDATIDGVAKSLARFEESTRGKDFKRFHREQAVAFKDRLAEAVNARTGERLSKATMLSTLRDLKAFFFWLAHLPGFKMHIRYDDCEYFNLTDKDVAIARAARDKPVPTLAQVARVLAVMPTDTVLARRDRALIAFAAISGARVSALASFQLGDIDLEAGLVRHDARHVRSKFSKTFTTFFMPIGGGALEIVQDWIAELRGEHLWGPADPLFPATQMGLGESGGFVATGLSRNGWSNSNPVREIFARAFAAAGLPYYNPHSFRAMLVSHAMALGLSLEHMKAWSQNLGHNDVLTTLVSYGSISAQRQGELIRDSAQAKAGDDWTKDADVQAMLKAIAAKAQRSGISKSNSPA